MSRIERLRAARDAYVVCWRKFLLCAARNPGSLHCFYEGCDSKYYLIRIELLTNRSPHEYKCAGKEGLLRLLHLYRSHPAKLAADALFFLDRDFDAPAYLPTDESLYVTDGYSIESHYVSPTCISKVLHNEYSLAGPEDDVELARVEAAVDVLVVQAAEALLDLNAWAAARRDMEKADPSLPRVRLAHVKLSTFLTVSLNGIQKNYELAELGGLFNVDSPPADQITSWREKLRLEGPRVSTRGKYLLDALRELLRLLQADRSSASPTLFATKGPSASLQLSRDNLISELAQYADSPPSLRDFLARAAA